MRLTLTVVDPLGGASADVVLDIDPESSVGDISRELAHHVGHGGGAQIIPLGGPRGAGDGSPLVYVDGRAVDSTATVITSPLREGAVVSLHDPAGCLPGEPTGLVELRVAGGPAAGAVHRLGVGRYEIGSGPASYIRIDDPELPARAATLSIATDGTCQVTVQAGTDGVRLDGAELEGDNWPLDSQLAIGNSLLELGRYSPPDAALKWSEDGAGLDYNRPPRLRPPERETRFRLPTPPRDREARPLPWLMAIFPLVSAIVMALLFGRWYYLIMAVMSPIMMVGNYFMDKKQGRKSHAKQVKEYKEHKARIDGEAQEALVAERLDRRRFHPDPATVLSLSTGPRTRLWERRRTDRDHLLLRMGTGRLPSEVVLDDPEQDDHRRQVTWKIDDAPVALPLATLGVIGLAGPGDSARSLARWAVSQIAVLHSPVDVQVYVLTEGSAQDSWDWVRWLPHARPSGAHDTNVLIGTDAETVGARIGELTQLLDARHKAAKEAGNKVASFSDPDIVVIWDGSRRLRSMPGVVRLLREGPAVAMYALCIDSEDRFLPGECQAIVVAEPRPEEHRSVKASVGAPAPQTPGGFPSFQAWHANEAPAEAAHGDPQAAAACRTDRLGARLRRTAGLRLSCLEHSSCPFAVAPA